jgi:predicted transcriptional regulator of viral defense system
VGKVIHINKVRDFMTSTPAFRTRDVELLVRDRRYASLLLHKMAKSGEIRRITKGWYTVRDDPLVSVFAFRPAYVGLQEALGLRDLWEQETNVVIVSSTRLRPGVRRILDSNVILHRIDAGHFFGIEYIRYGDFFIPVSDNEKTLIDLVYFNDLPGRDVLRRVVRSANKVRLDEYLKGYPERFRERVRKLLFPRRNKS